MTHEEQSPSKAMNISSEQKRGLNRDKAKIALKTAIAALEDAKAEDIITIDLFGKSALADSMIIASGRSNRHVSSIADDIIQAMKDHNLGTPRVEGIGAADWILIDQGDVVVHVFRPEVRAFYNLEKLWQAPEAQEAPPADKSADPVH